MPEFERLSRLACLWLPEGVATELAQRAGTFVGWLLDTAEANYRRGTFALQLVWAHGGGLDCQFVRVSEDSQFVLFGEMDLRTRALMYDTINALYRHEVPTERLRSVQARLAAEFCRYQLPERVPSLLAETDTTVVLPTWPDLDTDRRDERYMGLWALPVLHEAGHWFAANEMANAGIADVLTVRAEQDLHEAIRRLQSDPATEPWSVLFDPDTVSTAELIEEGLADAMMVDVLFEVWMKHFGGVDWGVLVEPSTLSMELAHAFVAPVAEQLVLWHLSLEWRVRLEAAVGALSGAEASRRLVLIELRRETMLRDFAMYLADPVRLGAFGYEYSTVRASLDRLALNRASTVRDPLARTIESLHEPPPTPRTPSPDVVKAFFQDTAAPVAPALLRLVEESGTQPRYIDWAPTGL